jgi:hypothetical protein
MDHLKILKRAFDITLHYRALWVFGILLALTTASNRGGGGNGGGGGGGGGSSQLPSLHLASLQLPEITAQVRNTFLGVIVLLICLGVLLVVAGVILRYVSETALIRMVDQHEITGEKAGVRQGFRLGWSRPAFRIFLIDLLFGLVGVAVFLLLLLVAAAPLLLWLTESEALRAIGTALTAILGITALFLLILAVIVFSLLVQFFRRACILEGLGVMEAIRRGWAICRGRLGDAIVMGILLFAIALALVVVLIPVAILLVLAGLVLGGLPGLLVGWLASQFAEGAVPWIAGGLVATPVFLLIVFVPLLFLGGLIEVYKSSAWTLAFREIVALEVAREEPALEG